MLRYIYMPQPGCFGDLSVDDYRALAEFRYQIRRFLHFSEQEARARDLEPAQHQLLLAVKGIPDGDRPTVREMAERLCIRHHSAVELVNRLERRGAVRRRRCQKDRREVLVELTPTGEELLRDLTVTHREEFETAGAALTRTLKAIMRNRTTGTRRTA
ncbi:MAG: MarR family transcriptional regulator [Bryobacteraceae bacterium]